MNSIVARLSALALAGLLALGVGALCYTSRDHGEGTIVKATFVDAWPLVAGMDVRISGAVAGNVRDVKLTDEGRAEVTLRLAKGAPQPRADASVAVRQQDLLGDSYLSLSTGAAPAPLRGPIPPSRALRMPRLDDLLDTFTDPVRAGLKTFIVELGAAMESRGVDLNATILKLRPGFAALSSLTNELRGQNKALSQALGNAHAVTSQLAGRTEDLDRLVRAGNATVVTAAEHADSLGSALERAPAAMRAARGTLAQVSRLGAALPPLAQAFTSGAPAFTRAAQLIGPFSAALRDASREVSPTLTLTGQALRQGAPGVRALAGIDFAQVPRAVGLATALRPGISGFLDGIFGSNNGGGLGGITTPGNDILDPATDPARASISAVLVPSCELVGQPIEPGCLAKLLDPTTPARRRHKPAARRPAQAAPAPGPQSAPAPAAPSAKNPVTGAVETVRSLLDFLLKP